MEKISIIIPTKNSQRHLNRCIDTILIQKYPDFEIIAVDSKSNDNTLSILDRYNVFSNKIKIIKHQKNISIGTARNIGLKNSSGTILAYIDSDVELPHKHWLENMAKPFYDGYSSYMFVPKEKIAGVQTLAKCKDTDPEILKKIHSSFEYNSDIIDICHYQTVGTSHLLIRKELIESVGGFIDSNMGEDENLTQKIINKKYKFIYLKEEKCYHHHVDNYYDYIKKLYRNKKYGLKKLIGNIYENL